MSPRHHRRTESPPAPERLVRDMQHLTEADLRDDIEGIISASDFMELTDGAQLLFI